MTGKIARLPRATRDELNRRLDEGTQPRDLCQWLNSLPEVQALLAAEFPGQPITKQNLYKWTQFGFRDWKLRQDVSDFLAAQESDPAENQPAPANLIPKLLDWLALHYAAAAHALAPAGSDPDAELRRLRTLSADILALRRGDLKAKRLALEEKRLALEEADADARTDEEFWAWTKLPDIRAQLDQQYQKNSLWNDALRTMVPELFAAKPQPDEAADPLPSTQSKPDETTDPAILI